MTNTALDRAIDVLGTFEDDADKGGEVEAPCGSFARVIVTADQIKECLELLKGVIYDEFYDEIVANPERLVGDWIVVTDYLGFIHTTRYTFRDNCNYAFDQLTREYTIWLESDSVLDHVQGAIDEYNEEHGQ